MPRTTSVNDQWILNQLIGIRMLEQELASAMNKPAIHGKAELRRRIRQLNAWVDAVDHSLSAGAHSHTA